MFTPLTRWVLRLRWAVLLLWGVTLLVTGVLAPRVFSVLKGGGFSIEGVESAQALEKLEALGLNQITMEAVFHSEALTFSDPVYWSQVQEALGAVLEVERVSRITGPRSAADSDWVSPDGHTAYAIIWIDADIDAAQELVPEVRAALGPPRDLEVYLTGSPAIFREMEEASERDLQRAEMITFPLVLGLLLLVFGSVVAAALPVAMGLTAVTVTLAFIYSIAAQVDMSIFTVNIATFLGLGIAIDYSLLMVSRFREELASQDAEGAVVTTMNTAGKAILFSALTTMLGMAGLLLFDIAILRSIGIAGIVVVAASLLVALTLMPALLSLLNHRVNALPLLPRRARWPRGIWRGIAVRVMQRPLLFILPVGALLLLLGTPFLHVRLGAAPASVLPPTYDSRKGWDLLTGSFGPGRTTPMVIAVEGEGGLFRPETLARLKEFTTALWEHQDVERVESIVDLDPRLGLEDYVRLYQDPRSIPIPALQAAVRELATDEVTLVQVFTRLDGNDEAAEELVRYVRSLQPQEGGLRSWTSGYTAAVMDLVDALYGQFPKAVLLIMASIYVVLLLLFRSVILPLKAVVMNGISVFASYGALVFVFQDGHFEELLGFTATGQIDLVLPIILFAILFGLSMDYEVFLLARIKESYDATGDNTASVAQGLERTGRIITSAALVMILVLSGLAFGDLVLIKALGVSMALAIAIDVSIVRVVLVPALMRLLGDLNWWAPRFMKGVAVPTGASGGPHPPSA